MKTIRISALAAVLGLSCAYAGEGAIADAMKDYHKGETSVSKHVGAGDASASDINAILKAYQDMAKATPPKGTGASWKEKTDALIKAVTAIKGGNKAAISDYKKAVNCKACHDVHRES